VQERRDAGRRHGDRTIADQAQRVLDLVRVFGDRVESNHARAALDGMREAEHLVDRFRVFGAGLEREERVFHR
jgi:hypothetical protein